MQHRCLVTDCPAPLQLYAAQRIQIASNRPCILWLRQTRQQKQMCRNALSVQLLTINQGTEAAARTTRGVQVELSTNQTRCKSIADDCTYPEHGRVLGRGLLEIVGAKHAATKTMQMWHSRSSGNQATENQAGKQCFCRRSSSCYTMQTLFQ